MERYIIVYKPRNLPVGGSGAQEIINCSSVEAAFVKKLQLETMGEKVEIFQSIELKVVPQ